MGFKGNYKLHRASYLAAAEATRTNVYMTGRAIDNSFYTLDVGLPGSVAASVGVADLYTESNTLIAKFTLSHLLHLLACTTINSVSYDNRI